MEKILFFLTILFCAFYSQSAFAQPAAPKCDAFGYCYRTDTHSTAPVAYQWIELGPNAKTLSGLGDDNVAGPIPIGFSFNYYWMPYEQLYLGTNGYVMFGRITNIASLSTGFPAFPTPTGNPLINNYLGMLLCDLTFTDVKGDPIPGAAIKYGNVGDSLFVLTYENVPFWVSETQDPKAYAGSNTFQLILHKNSGNITVNYQKQEGRYANAYNNADIPVSIGMENISGDIGLQFFGRAGVLPQSESCVRIFRKQNITYQIKDASVDWVFNPNSYSRMITLDKSNNITDIKAQVSNAGTANLRNVNVRRRIINPQTQREITAFTDLVTIEQLNVGQSQEVVFETIPVNLSEVGLFTVRIDLSFENPEDDEISINNSLRGLLAITDFQKEAQVVGYESYDVSVPMAEQFKGLENTDISARFKVGMYFEPPYYPCRITDVYVAQLIGANPGPDTLLGFKLNFYLDNGPNGGPGTKITEIIASPEDIAALYEPIPNSAQPIFVQKPIPLKLDIAAGGIYVSWENLPPVDPEFPNHNDFLMIDTDRSYPKSNRLFEISGGAWAPHRSRPEDDMVMKFGILSPPVSRDDIRSSILAGEPFPNPTNSGLNLPITLNQTEQVSVIVTDGLGRVVYSRKAENFAQGKHNLEINTDAWTPGVYSYSLRTEKGMPVSKTFVVTK